MKTRNVKAAELAGPINCRRTIVENKPEDRKPK